MVDENTLSLINKQTGELAFKLYRFDSIHHFDHVQRLNYFSLVWIQQGQGRATTDFSTYEYSDNYFFAFAPYQPFFFEAHTPTQGVIIHFHTDFFCILKHDQEVACNGILFNNVYQSPFVILTQQAIDTMSMIVREMEKDIRQDQLAMKESVVSYLKLLLIHGARLKNQQLSNRPPMDEEETLITQKLKDLIEAHYREMHAPKDYADALHISPKALAKISKKHFNKTLTSLIAERIIIEAKRELYLTSKPVREIASDLGYEDEFYFSRFFKKNTKISPSVFRKTVGFGRGEG